MPFIYISLQRSCKREFLATIFKKSAKWENIILLYLICKKYYS